MTDYKALCAELLAAADEYAGMNPYMRLDNAMKAARAALAEPVTPDDVEVAKLVVFLREGVMQCTEDFPKEAAMVSRAAELLERQAPQPVPEGPSDEELEKLADDYMAMDGATGVMCLGHLDFARAVLARWGQP